MDHAVTATGWRTVGKTVVAVFGVAVVTVFDAGLDGSLDDHPHSFRPTADEEAVPASFRPNMNSTCRNCADWNPLEDARNSRKERNSVGVIVARMSSWETIVILIKNCTF